MRCHVQGQYNLRFEGSARPKQLCMRCFRSFYRNSSIPYFSQAVTSPGLNYKRSDEAPGVSNSTVRTESCEGTHLGHIFSKLPEAFVRIFSVCCPSECTDVPSVDRPRPSSTRRELRTCVMPWGNTSKSEICLFAWIEEYLSSYPIKLSVRSTGTFNHNGVCVAVFQSQSYHWETSQSIKALSQSIITRIR